MSRKNDVFAGISVLVMSINNTTNIATRGERVKGKKYIEYDYESTFDEDINKASEMEIQKLLDQGKVKCVYATKTITSGSQVEVEIYPEFTRKQKKNNSTIVDKHYEAQKKLNNSNSRKQAIRVVNVNFGDGDIWATLTYDKDHLPDTEKEMLKNMKNYIRRLQYQRKKIGLPIAKYFYITEFDEKNKLRCHHHLIIDGLQSMDMVESIWKCGRRNHTRRTSTDDRGLTGIGTYLSKDPKGSKRWCSSMNLRQPTIRKNHQDFRMKQIRQMTENRNMIRELIEKKYKGMVYLDESAKFNEYNGRTYFYIRLAIPKEERKKKRE